MSDHVATVSSVNPVPTGSSAAGGDDFRQAARTQIPDTGRYRLTIEEGPDGFVYKTLDRVTGEVIRQFPREEVLRMKASPAYDRGGVFDTSA